MDESKVVVTPNWVDDRLFTECDARDRDTARDRCGWDDAFVYLFAGNLGLVQGLDTVLRAAALVPAETNLKVVFLGDGADRTRLERLAADLRLGRRVEFRDPVPADQMRPYLAAADALLVHLRRSPLSRLVIPTKTLSYLAAGRPILMAMEGAAADLVSAAGAGMVVGPDGPGELADAMIQLSQLPEEKRRQMGGRGRAFVRERFAKENVIGQSRVHPRGSSRAGSVRWVDTGPS